MVRYTIQGINISDNITDISTYNNKSNNNNNNNNTEYSAFYITGKISSYPVTLSDVITSFPLYITYKYFHFHFRFKISSPDKKLYDEFVWVDVTDPSSHVPYYGGNIIMKVLMLPVPPRSVDLPDRSDRRTSEPSVAPNASGTQKNQNRHDHRHGQLMI
eukprot:GHVR01041275.1.p2 GENE.GHVR01041275.1~~GHVR01041275.1.p2  ORF type:complete len:178 (-),score=52.36 GHVR01041275.1:634-1110(-)